MIGILDYGIGNVHAFKNVYDSLGVPSLIIKDNSLLSSAQKFILPGVGSFDSAITKLKLAPFFDNFYHRVVHEKTPLLGVCIGMHMLSTSSEEGSLPGLDLIPGRVKKLPVSSSPQFVLPHIGWNSVNILSDCPLVKGLQDPYFYFLHSYYFEPLHDESIVFEFTYTDNYICGVCHENIYGVQFHPEKSHDSGRSLLFNFSQL